MRKKLYATLGATALVATMGACGGVDTGTGENSGGTGETGKASIQIPEACNAENPYLAVLLPNQQNPYYVAMKRGFEDEGKAKGFNVEVQIANDDDANQLAQAQAMLQKNPCALALNPVKSEPAAAIVKAANDAGVPVFTVNIIVDPDALSAQGASVVQYVGANNHEGGVQMAEKVLADFGADAKLNIGYVTEPDELPVVQRDLGFREKMKSNPNAKDVAEVDGNVKPDDSLNVTSAMIQGNPDINVIFASTGPAAYGALQAVQASGKDIKVYGFCAAGETLTDAYPGCVAQEPEEYGRILVQQIAEYKQGKSVESELLQSLKQFEKGQTPGEGELG